MSIDDNWGEALRKSAELITPGDPSETRLRTRTMSSALPDGAATLAEQQLQTALLALIAGAGAPVFREFFGDTTPGVSQTLISATVPVGKVWSLKRAIVPCRQPGIFTIEADNVVVGSGRTGAANQNASFDWNPIRPFTAGQVVTVKFQSVTGVPASSLEAYLMAVET